MLEDERPPRPFNLSVVPHRNSLQVTWSVPTGHPTQRPADYHIVQYRTVGQWVPLSNRIAAGQFTYNWTTASRGAVYHFRVIGYYDPVVSESDDDQSVADPVADDIEGGPAADVLMLQSMPSLEVVVNTGGKYCLACLNNNTLIRCDL